LVDLVDFVWLVVDVAVPASSNAIAVIAIG
jgi:hypothetical protein